MMKVLLIDDKRCFHRLWTWQITNRFSFLHAYTIPQARLLFNEHPDLAAIVIDACMDDGPWEIGWHISVREWGLNTRDLIKEYSESYSGPIIAAPSQWWHFELMKSAGCTHHCWKWGVAPLLKKLLLS